MSDPPPARVERDGPLAVVVIDHPPLNLFGEPLVRALSAAFDEVAGSDARALVIRAEGRVFTGGADVNEFKAIVAQGGGRDGAAFDVGLEMIHRLEALPIPTLSLVHALCLTAGLELSLGCDMIWAAESSRFGLVEAVVGLTPGGAARSGSPSGPAPRGRGSS